MTRNLTAGGSRPDTLYNLHGSELQLNGCCALRSVQCRYCGSPASSSSSRRADNALGSDAVLDSLYDSTKDCCAASAGRATHFREDLHVCANDNIASDNSLNTGAMVSCCGSRGMGSKALASPGDPLDPPKCSNKKRFKMDRERSGVASLNKRKGCTMTISLGSPPTAGFGMGVCQAGGGKRVLSDDIKKCNLNYFAKHNALR